MKHAAAKEPRPSLTWIRKHRQGSGGDEIYDNRVCEQLSSVADISTVEVPKAGRSAQLAALLAGVPHNRYKYPSAQKALRRLERDRSTGLVISWEALEATAWRLDRSATLIVHNVISDLSPQIFPHPFLGQLAGAWSARWEKRLYARPNLSIVTLSRFDAALIRKLAPDACVVMAPPGAPPPIPLTSGSLVAELVLSGTYMWYPKRRDLHYFEEEYPFGPELLPIRLDCDLPPRSDRSLLREMSSPISVGELSQGLRFGVITDRFSGGFKLKALSFIASNCIVLTYAKLAGEFAHIPDSELFIREVGNINEIEDVVSRMQRRDGAALLARWLAFKKACLDYFTWERTAAVIGSTLR